MITLLQNGAYLLNNTEVVEANNEAEAILKSKGVVTTKEEAKQSTMAYNILKEHNTSGNMENLEIKFDKITSHDITFVGIIQTARASGMERFPLPYILTNCHNSLCAVGGTINEDDHMFGLTAAQKYGGVYVPPHQAVIHQFAREMLATCGGMILGSDSHTRYGSLGTMAIGEGGGELAKQLLKQTYDVNMPGVVAVYMEGSPSYGVGPQDVALAIIGAVFDNGFVKNKVMEFVGPGINNLSAEFRIGVDVMTTETTCLSSIWKTDEKIKEFYDIHGRIGDYKEIDPGVCSYYDGVIKVDLGAIKPMIAMPFHPSNAYPIADVKVNLKDYLNDCEERAKVSFGDKIDYSLKDKVIDGKLYVEQGIIAGCAGGTFENICDAADILKKTNGIGNDKFTLNVYPASMPIQMELVKNGVYTTLLEKGAVMKTAFCGPCFGAGDTPANNAFSVRHATRNFPNREGSKVQDGQISSVALMDAKSVAATAANKGFLTGADEFEGIDFTKPKYYFDKGIYETRVFDSKGVADSSVEIAFGPNIKDWPAMTALTDDLMLKVVCEIHDPITTTDELIPSGETSSYRSNPLGLAEFTLSRKDPEYVGRAKDVFAMEADRREGKAPAGELADVYDKIKKQFPNADAVNTALGSTIYAVKPGDGSAREQAASCQKVLGAWANIAQEYATKRYRSNMINWGMIPFLFDKTEIPFKLGDYIYVPGVKKAIENQDNKIKAYVIGDTMTEFEISIGELTDNERSIILAGSLINYNNLSK
jgi:aconitate hydratase